MKRNSVITFAVSSLALALIAGYGLQGILAPGDSTLAALPTSVAKMQASILPEDELYNALTALAVYPDGLSVLSLEVPVFPEESLFAGLGAPDHPVAVPYQAKDQLMIQFRPDLDRGDVASFLSEFDLKPVQTLPELGVVVVQTSTHQGTAATSSIPALEALGELGITSLIDKLSADPRVVVATPNSFLSTFVLRSAVAPSIPPAHVEADSNERVDWGIIDANIEPVWPLLSSQIRVGVIDVGFAQHSDLQLEKGLSVPERVADHGTHVSGIMCAQHNGFGVKGVLKHCTVVYSPSTALLTRLASIEGQDIIAMSTLISEYMATVMDFIRENPGIKIINLSLGYNWMPNFSEDPRNNRVIRDIVRGQGRIYMSLLEFAAEKDIALVSAAGNDSASLGTPLEARWASPFNFGSMLMRKYRGWSNGLVVQAHDQYGNRASFSNYQGDISCPGVGILSTVAEPHNAVRLMSGTSMAAPYCAAGLAALRSVLPNLTLSDAMRCIQRSPNVSGSVPRLNLEYAIANCSPSNLDSSVDDRIKAIEAWAHVLQTETVGSTATSPCRYSMRASFPISTVADEGDGQGPEFVDPTARASIEAYSEQLVSSGCTNPVLIVLPLSFTPEFRDTYEFALAIMSILRADGYPGEIAFIEWPLSRRVGSAPALEDRVIVLIGDDLLRQSVTASRDPQ